MALAWAIYLCGPQSSAQHITCQKHLDAQSCSSSNFIQSWSMPSSQPSSLYREEEYRQQYPYCSACAWLNWIVVGGYSPPRTLLHFFVDRSSFLHSGLLRLKKEQLKIILRVCYKYDLLLREGYEHETHSLQLCSVGLAKLNKFWLEFIGVGSLFSLSPSVSPQRHSYWWIRLFREQLGNALGLKNCSFFAWKKKRKETSCNLQELGCRATNNSVTEAS